MKEQDVPRILASLKAILRARGVTYATVARELDVHEATVKRYLNGGVLPLTTLEQICRVAGIRVIDLVEAALLDDEPGRAAVTLEQEAVLVGNRYRAFLFYLLQCGWTLPRIRAEFALGEAELTEHLLILDKAALIRLMPNNRVRVLVARRPEWEDGGPARRSFDQWVSDHFSGERLADIDDYEAETVKIGRRSIAMLRRMMRELADAAGDASRRDRHLPPEQLEWYGLFAAIRPIDPLAITTGSVHSIGRTDR